MSGDLWARTVYEIKTGIAAMIFTSAVVMFGATLGMELATVVLKALTRGICP